MPVPISLAELNTSLRSGDKAILAEVLTSGVVCPPDIPPEDESCLIIDGQALVIAIGKPHGAVTFGDFADAFVQSVLHSGRNCARIDVTFDRYYPTSIKGNTRLKRSKGARPVRRVIEDRSVPLPANWTSFLALNDNKADLARFLSLELVRNAPQNKTIIVAGGLDREDEVLSSTPSMATNALEGHHEEADTRIVLHCMCTEADTIIVSARDTDVLVLLIAHFNKMRCTKLWMKAGTAKHRKYLPIHTICEHLPLHQNDLEVLIPFHALTGCDTVSHISGHSKKTAWKVFLTDWQLLIHLGKEPLNDETIKSAETFICKIYNQSDLNNSDDARVRLFHKCRSPEALPPTSDALTFHIQRAHYQAIVWRQAVCKDPDLPSATEFGWTLCDGKMIPRLMSYTPVPDSCAELVSCGCTRGCSTQRCSCKKSNLPCSRACKCTVNDGQCRNH